MDLDQNTFSRAFYQNLWGGVSSRSGPGSSLEQTRVIRERIPELLNRLQVRTMLDIPCGDFHWMKEIRGDIEPNLSLYIGADIVPELIHENRIRYQNSKFRFEVLDLTKDALPRSDLVMIRDCFLHLPFRGIADAIWNVQRSGSTYMLASTYTKPRPNLEIENISLLGRAINLSAPPFSFPEPLELINEECTEQNGEYSDKSIGLWRITDVDVSRLRRQLRTREIVKEGKRNARRVFHLPRHVVSAFRQRIQ